MYWNSEEVTTNYLYSISRLACVQYAQTMAGTYSTESGARVCIFLLRLRWLLATSNIALLKVSFLTQLL